MLRRSAETAVPFTGSTPERRDPAAGLTDYNWEGVFSGDGAYGRHIEVEVGATTEWIVVSYTHSIGTDRLGWQIVP
ncbi:MAG: hypothetical protein GY724_21820 [Actinomycetia bacterium]|nr:hypothetical protein [Actinomycetes bacterium]